MKRYWVLALLIILPMLFVACAPAEPQIVEKEVVRTVVVEKEIPVEKKVIETVVVEKEVVKDARQGGTAILTTSESFQGPAADFDGGSTHDTRLMGLYFDPLMLTKMDGSLEPRLATSIDLSADGLTWTINLRDDAKWHDGKPITADDVIFTLNTMCSGKTDPPTILYNLVAIEGCQDYRDGKATEVSGITKVNDTTVQLKAMKVNMALLGELASKKIAPAHVWKAVPLDKLSQDPRWLDKPVASGPFKMVNYVGDQVIEFEAFEDYYLGRPYLDKVIVRIAPYDTALAALEGGEVQFVPYLDTADAKRLERDPMFRVDKTNNTAYWSLFFHFYQEELRDTRIRHAIIKAIDRDAYNAAVLGGFGSTVVKQLFTPGTWPADPSLEPYKYDPEGARALFEEAGFDFENRVMGIGILPANKPRARIGEVVQANLAAIGVKSEVIPIEESIILEQWVAQKDKLWFTIAYMGGTPANPYGAFPTFYTTSDKNWGFYVCSFASQNPLEECGGYIFGNKELDALMDKAVAATGQEEAQPIFWEIDRWFYENPHAAPVVAPATIHAWNSRLVGFEDCRVYDCQYWTKPEEWWLEK